MNIGEFSAKRKKKKGNGILERDGDGFVAVLERTSLNIGFPRSAGRGRKLGVSLTTFVEKQRATAVLFAFAVATRRFSTEPRTHSNRQADFTKTSVFIRFAQCAPGVILLVNFVVPLSFRGTAMADVGGERGWWPPRRVG